MPLSRDQRAGATRSYADADGDRKGRERTGRQGHTAGQSAIPGQPGPAAPGPPHPHRRRRPRPVPRAIGGQPRHVERSQIPSGEFGADADDSRQRVLSALYPLTRFVLAGQVEDHRFGSDRHAYVAIDAVLPGVLRAEEHPRQPEHDPMRTPVRQVQVRVVVKPHHLLSAATEIPPVVLVRETSGSDPGSRRELANLGLLGSGQRTVDRKDSFTATSTPRTPVVNGSTRLYSIKL